MKRWYLLSILTLVFFVVRGEEKKFPVSAIPEALKKDVNAVVREDRIACTILARDKSKTRYYMAVTIFNSKASDFAERVLFYDKLTKVSEIKANVYDAEGKLIKKLKNSDIVDQSAYDGVTMYSDNRLKIIDLRQGFYPYTIEIEYEETDNFLLTIPGSVIIPDENVSVQLASYQLVYPEELKPRYRWHNTNVEPVKYTTPEGFQSLLWTFENLASIKEEPYSSLYELVPYIEAAPTAFAYQDYAGEMSSWENFGYWIASLNKGRNVLPPTTIEKIRQITAGAKSDEEKIRIIYEYLQNKTRYVSIQLGIGGYQPFEASVVDKSGYGDCKALSNYMVSMLDVVGIKGYYALIYAGNFNREVDINFPRNQFNHAIVAVPNKGDTIWLECTSQTLPFGYQGTFTCERKALLIAENGGVLVNTTRFPADKNVLSRVADVTVDLTGNASAKVKTSYSGLQYESDNLDAVVNNPPDEQKKWIQNHTRIPSFDLVSFSLNNEKSRIPQATIQATYSLPKYATVTDKRVFLVPNLMNRQTSIPEKLESRKTDVVLKRAYVHHDTIRYKIPETLHPEFLPEPFKIKSRFGEYEAGVKVEQGMLIYTRRLKVEKGRFPAGSYNELVDFYKSVSKADNTKILFLNKT